MRSQQQQQGKQVACGMLHNMPSYGAVAGDVRMWWSVAFWPAWLAGTDDGLCTMKWMSHFVLRVSMIPLCYFVNCFTSFLVVCAIFSHAWTAIVLARYTCLLA
jgi:hypothetical protein